MSIYYGIYGDNACAVFTNWFKTEKGRQYIKNSTCKKFNDYNETQEFALNGFANRIYLRDTSNFQGIIPETLEPDIIIFKKNL